MLDLLDSECTTPQDPKRVLISKQSGAQKVRQQWQFRATVTNPLEIRNRNKAWTLVLGQDEDKGGLKYKTGVETMRMRKIMGGETNDEWNPG